MADEAETTLFGFQTITATKELTVPRKGRMPLAFRFLLATCCMGRDVLAAADPFGRASRYIPKFLSKAADLLFDTTRDSLADIAPAMLARLDSLLLGPISPKKSFLHAGIEAAAWRASKSVRGDSGKSGDSDSAEGLLARLLAKIYHSLGILSKGQLVEVDEFHQEAVLLWVAVVHEKSSVDPTPARLEAVPRVPAANPPPPRNHLAAVRIAPEQLDDEVKALVLIICHGGA